MYNVSDNFNTLASSNNRTVSCKITINGTDIDPGLIVSLKFKEASSSGSNISLGEAISNVIELQIYNTDIQLKGAEIKPYISFDGEEYCPLGIFYASEINKDKTYINITAYDKMAFLNEKYVPTVTFPTSANNVVTDIAKQYGFKSVSINYATLINELDTEYTVREIIGYIAGKHGTNAKFNRLGYLQFKFYTFSGIALKDEVFLDGQSDTSEDEYTISALVSGSGDNEIKIGNGKAIIFENPFVDENDLYAIQKRILPFSYTAAKVKYRGNPAIEIGDYIYVYDVDDNQYRIPVMSQEFEFNGGLSATIESYGLSDEMDVISNLKSDKVEFNRRITTLEQMQNKILGSDGGYYEVLLDKNDNNRPYGTAWWSDQSKTQGWKFTYGGLGYFNNNTLQHIGITNDGNIVANNIASNGLITNSFTIGKVDSDDTNYAMKFDGNTGKITFGSGVTISWSDIQDTPANIATKDEIPTNISQLTGSENLATKDEIPTVPTKLSQLANDTGFATTGDIPVNISQLINDSGFKNFEEVVQISKDTITAPFIASLNLKVGNEIQMGENAVISWGNISGTDNVATKDEIPTVPTNISDFTNDAGYITAADVPDMPTEEYITTISRNAITSEVIKGWNLEVGNQVKMGANATLSWNNISSKPTIPTDISDLTGSENLATKDEIPKVPTKLSELANDAGFAYTGDIPTNISQLANDAGFQDYAGVVQISRDTIDAPFIRALKLKVGTDIEMGENAVIKWSNISDSPTIPTNTSQLTNDSGFATTTYVNTAIGSIQGITLPSYITSTKITSTTIEAPAISGGTILSSKIQTDKLYIQKSGYVYDTDTSKNVRFIYMVGDSTSDTEIRLGRVSINGYSNKYNSIDFNDASQERIITLNTDVVNAPIIVPDAIDLTNGVMYSSAYPGASVTIRAASVNNGSNTAGFFRPTIDAGTSFKNGIMYLGGSNYKWKAIYCATGTINTSDRNLKTDITDLDSKYLDLFDRLQPVQYKLLSGDRIHTGFVAQDIEASMTEVGLTAEDFGGFCKDLKEDSTDEYIYGLRYEEFIAINTAKIKQLEQKIKELEATINSQMG